MDADKKELTTKMDADKKELTTKIDGLVTATTASYNEARNQRYIFLGILLSLSGVFSPIASYLSAVLKTVP
jgi:hypothetical protein